jgi:hypothetical protein
MNRYHVWRMMLIIIWITAAAVPAVAQDDPVRIVFMHHSTGAGLIAQGDVRAAFTELGYEFWDHGYNGDGLVDAEGNILGTNWDMPGDNTDPDGWNEIFAQEVTDPPSNTFSHMLEYDVIIFKSCFPASDIQSEEHFQTYQSYFLAIRDVIDQHPDKLFIAFTTPPLVPGATTAENAARARGWSEYLTSAEFLDGHPNLVVFNFFDLLAGDDNYLRADYRIDESDSHPNELANQTIGPIFVEFVDQAIRDFIPGEAPVIEEATAEVEDSTPEEVPVTVSSDGNMIADFELADTADRLWVYHNDDQSVLNCALVDGGYESDSALQLDFDIVAGSSAGCGFDLEPDPAWADAAGFSFMWRSDKSDLFIRPGMGVFDPAQANPDVQEATPFDIEMLTVGEEWTELVLLWDDLTKPDWVGDTGIDEFNPAQVIWLVFDVGHWEQAQQGTIWIDNIQLVPKE